MPKLVVGVGPDPIGTITVREGKADFDTGNSPGSRDTLQDLFTGYVQQMVLDGTTTEADITVEAVLARMDERMNGRTWAQFVKDDKPAKPGKPAPTDTPAAA